MTGSSRIDTLLCRALQQLGMPEAGNDWRPRTSELEAVLASLRDGDVDGAVEWLDRAPADADLAEVRILRHVLVLFLDAESDRLVELLREQRKIRLAAEGESHLLDLRLSRQRYQHAARLGWITLVCAIVIVLTTVLAVTRFGLDLPIALGGLAAFALGAWLLLLVDGRRQRRSHHEAQAALRAEVAEEQQILRVEIRQRVARETELEARRDALAGLRDRVVGVRQIGDTARRRTT